MSEACCVVCGCGRDPTGRYACSSEAHIAKLEALLREAQRSLSSRWSRQERDALHDSIGRVLLYQRIDTPRDS